MASLQLPRLASVPQQDIEKLPTLRLNRDVDPKALKSGPYKVKRAQEIDSRSDAENPTAVNAEVWFKSPVSHFNCH